MVMVWKQQLDNVVSMNVTQIIMDEQAQYAVMHHVNDHNQLLSKVRPFGLLFQWL